MTDPRSQYSALIGQFGEGWEKADPNLLLRPFGEDSVFVAGPFDPPLRGSTEIARYWRDVAYEQAEIAFRFGEIYVAGPWFSTEFRCTFRRRRSGEAVDVRGALFCETRDGKIAELRMYWHRNVGPIRA